MTVKIRMCAALMVATSLAGCVTGGGTTSPGFKQYQAGRYSDALPLLQGEAEAQSPAAAYALGMMYLTGQGIDADPAKGEELLINSAMLGEGRAYGELKRLYGDAPKCDKDKALAQSWSTISVMYRNLITGRVEIFLAPNAMQRQMAAIYLDPCEGRPRLERTARQLDAWSRQPRQMWVYVPG